MYFLIKYVFFFLHGIHLGLFSTLVTKKENSSFQKKCNSWIFSQFWGQKVNRDIE